MPEKGEIRGASLPKNRDKEWLTVEDIYEELGRTVPPDTIRSWIRTKRLPAYKPGKAYLVKREDLDKFLESSRTKPEEEP